MNYVVGFMFSADHSQIALIRKQKPAWQRGKLNGIGGKIEDGEFPFTAMAREFLEETGFSTDTHQWTRFCEMAGGKNDDGGAFQIHFFFTIGDLSQLVSAEAEQIEITNTGQIGSFRSDVVENLPWLIALALDSMSDGRPNFATVTYP